MLGQTVDLVVGDLSFISIRTVFPAIQKILNTNGFIVMLIKPQFEIGKGKVGKKGIVRDKEDHLSVLLDMYDFLVGQNWSVLQIVPSSITGKTGNVEFLLHAVPTPHLSIHKDEICAMVDQVHTAQTETS
jgi:23S rRNA (cytidine1920-2'-O)/16S rRNA (cytidine1409-2'-O)-methyltransferase